MTSFDTLPILEELKRATAAMGFTEMTEIQRKAIPVMLEGREVIAKAPTGTGKTCAFGIPILQNLKQEAGHVQALILCPTRELCTQIVDELRDLAQFLPQVKVVAVYGGAPIRPQTTALKAGAQIVVATPGRLLDHLAHKTVDLRQVETVVLDEADEMLDMGFMPDVRRILDRVKSRKQMVMFSATISREVMDIGWIYQKDAVELMVEAIAGNKPKITQYSLMTTGRKKFNDLLWVMHHGGFQRILIFCNTKYATASLSEMLAAQGWPADCLHGDMIQKDRNEMMRRYKDGELPILVATDVAARGIDVSDIDVVINYDVPQDNETYTHRIGRTARAKKEGVAYTFYAPTEAQRLKNIIRYTRNTLTPMEISPDGKISYPQGE